MKVYLDDCRTTPNGWTRTYTPQQTIEILKTHNVTALSLDHDLGDDEGIGTGYTVLLWIEEHVVINGYEPPSIISIHSSNPSARSKMLAAIEAIQILAKKNKSFKRVKLSKVKKLNEKLLCISKLVFELSKPLRELYEAEEGLASGSDDFEFDYRITTYNRSGNIVSVTDANAFSSPTLSPEEYLLSGDFDDTWRRYHRHFDTCYTLHSIEQHHDSIFYLGRKAEEDDLLSISSICLYERIEHQFFEEIPLGMKYIDAALFKIASRVNKVKPGKGGAYLALEIELAEISDNSCEKVIFNIYSTVDNIDPKCIIKHTSKVKDLFKYKISYTPWRKCLYMLSVSFHEVREYHGKI